VVSADQEIVEAAQRRRMRVISPDEFAHEMDSSTVPGEDQLDPHLSPGEIDEWLALFGGEPDEKPE